MTFKAVVVYFLSLLSLLIPIIIGLAFVALMWGVVRAWILNGASAEGATEGKAIALWGVIGLMVMISFWGIVAMVRSSFGL